MFGINANKLSFCGVTASLAVIFIYIASVMPTLKIAFCFASSVLICTVVIKYDKKTAFSAYLVSAAVALLVAADKSVAAAYFLLFGNYPSVKACLESNKNIFAEWALKTAVFCLYAFAGYFACRLFFPSFLNFKYSAPLMLVLFLAFAAVYDIALSLVITEIKRRFISFFK